MVDGARRYARRIANEVQVEEYPVTFSHEDANVSENGYGDPAALRLAIGKLPAAQREAVEMFLWLGIALPYGAAVVLLASPRDDLAQKLADARFLIEQTTAFATALRPRLPPFR